MGADARKVAVVTGASSGIGRSLAKALAASGHRVVAADVAETGLKETMDLLGPGGGITCVTDVSDPAEVEALADLAWATYGRVDVVCNNAGVLGPLGDPLWEIPVEEWHRVLSVNFFGVLHGIRAFVPRLLEDGRPAHLVNTASMGGFTVGPITPQYNASKHAVVSLTESLRQQLASRESPISVHLLAPGPVNTNIVAAQQARSGEGAGTQQDWGAKAIGAPTPHLHPDDVASAVIKAIADDRFYIFPNEGSKERLEQRMARIWEAFA